MHFHIVISFRVQFNCGQFIWFHWHILWFLKAMWWPSIRWIYILSCHFVWKSSLSKWVNHVIDWYGKIILEITWFETIWKIALTYLQNYFWMSFKWFEVCMNEYEVYWDMCFKEWFMFSMHILCMSSLDESYLLLHPVPS